MLVAVRGCETWSFKLKVNVKDRVLENRVLRGIFQCKGNKEKKDEKISLFAASCSVSFAFYWLSGLAGRRFSVLAGKLRTLP